MTNPIENRLHILQNGVPRSGNLWLQYLLRHCLDKAGIAVRQNITADPVAEVLARRDLGITDIAAVDYIRVEPVRCFYTVLDAYQWPIEDLDAYVDGSTYVCTHSPWNMASRDVYARFSHIIYLVRDPRDAALSMARFAVTPYNRLHWKHGFSDASAYLTAHFPSLLETWARHVSGHLKHREDARIHFISYERLLTSPDEEIARLLRYLGLDLDRSAIQDALSKHSFERLRQRQPHHLAVGQWGQWRDALSKHQIAQAARVAGPLLEYFGYPLDARALDTWSIDEVRAGAAGT